MWEHSTDHLHQYSLSLYNPQHHFIPDSTSGPQTSPQACRVNDKTLRCCPRCWIHEGWTELSPNTGVLSRVLNLWMGHVTHTVWILGCCPRCWTPDAEGISHNSLCLAFETDHETSCLWHMMLIQDVLTTSHYLFNWSHYATININACEDTKTLCARLILIMLYWILYAVLNVSLKGDHTIFPMKRCACRLLWCCHNMFSFFANDNYIHKSEYQTHLYVTHSTTLDSLFFLYLTLAL